MLTNVIKWDWEDLVSFGIGICLSSWLLWAIASLFPAIPLHLFWTNLTVTSSLVIGLAASICPSIFLLIFFSDSRKPLRQFRSSFFVVLLSIVLGFALPFT